MSTPTLIVAAVFLVLFGSNVSVQGLLLSVVKLAEAENTEVSPPEQDDCTWNSYCVIAERPETGREVVAEVVLVHEGFPVGL